MNKFRLMAYIAAFVFGANVVGLFHYARHGEFVAAMLCAVGCAAFTYSLPYMADMIRDAEDRP